MDTPCVSAQLCTTLSPKSCCLLCPQAWLLGQDPQLTWSMVSQPLFIKGLLGGHGALQLETLFIVRICPTLASSQQRLFHHCLED